MTEPPILEDSPRFASSSHHYRAPSLFSAFRAYQRALDARPVFWVLRHTGGKPLKRQDALSKKIPVAVAPVARASCHDSSRLLGGQASPLFGHRVCYLGNRSSEGSTVKHHLVLFRLALSCQGEDSIASISPLSVLMSSTTAFTLLMRLVLSAGSSTLKAHTNCFSRQ